jgi:hypothetical protein
LRPECFAYFKHVKIIRPANGLFLFIPNTRFQNAIPDLPPSYHGVSSKDLNIDLDEQRQLLLIDVKMSVKPQTSLRALMASRIGEKLNKVKTGLSTLAK